MALHEIEVDLSRNESCVTPIAVVGMAFRFPGDLGDELSFWQALTDKRDLVTQIDSQRWDTERLQHPTLISSMPVFSAFPRVKLLLLTPSKDFYLSSPGSPLRTQEYALPRSRVRIVLFM